MAKVTLDSLAQDIAYLQKSIDANHLVLLRHIEDDKDILETKIDPLWNFKTRVYAIIALLGTVIAFIGWDVVRNVFVFTSRP